MGKKTDLFEGRSRGAGREQGSWRWDRRYCCQKDRPLRGAFEGAVKKTDLFEGREGAMDPFDGAW